MYVQIPTLESESVRTRTYVHVINTNYHPPNPRFGSKIQSLGGRKGVLGGSGPPKPPIRVSRPPKPGFGGPGGGSKPRFGPPQTPDSGVSGPPSQIPRFSGGLGPTGNPLCSGPEKFDFYNSWGRPLPRGPKDPPKKGVFEGQNPGFTSKIALFWPKNPESGVWGGSGPPNQPRGLVYKNSI